MRKKLAVILTSLWAVSVLQAAHVGQEGYFKFDSELKDLYAPCEFNLDVYGSYIFGPNDGRKNHERWGGGAGLNYFFTREIGIGGQFDAADNHGHFVDSVSGSIIARFPLANTRLAPYVFGGGGRTTEHDFWRWTGHAGGGLEFRFNPNFGIFIDGRWTFIENATDRGLVRSGIRFGF